VGAVKPVAEVEKALQIPVREAIQQEADEATFRRRAQAVEKERAIQENELQTQVELTRREAHLIHQRGENERKRATDEAGAARIAAEAAADLISGFARGRVGLELRTMVEARLDDGQRLLALSEVFVGHQTDQSARYRLTLEGEEERHSSSGLIVSTGTGATGWARSINLSRRHVLDLPGPTDESLAFFVREAFPSVATGTRITGGRTEAGRSLAVTSEMHEGGVVFGDGIEEDHLELAWGQHLRVQVAPSRLSLVRS
jgi:hypothetical protein